MFDFETAERTVVEQVVVVSLHIKIIKYPFTPILSTSNANRTVNKFVNPASITTTKQSIKQHLDAGNLLLAS